MSKVTMDLLNAQSDYYPQECMICVDRKATKIHFQEFTYYPSWTYLGIFGVLILAWILMEVYKKKWTVYLHLCDECHGKFKSLTAYNWLVGLGCVALFFGAIFAIADGQITLSLILFALTIIAPIYYFFAYHRKYAITCSMIDDYNITINLPNDRYPPIYYNYMDSFVGFRSQPIPAPPGIYNQPAGRTAPGLIACRHCNYENIPGSQFCTKCGNIMPRLE